MVDEIEVGLSPEYFFPVLKSGYLVQIRSGSILRVALSTDQGDMLYSDTGWFILLNNYTHDKHSDPQYDICTVWPADPWAYQASCKTLWTTPTIRFPLRDHLVALGFEYIAKNRDGSVFAFQNKPECNNGVWVLDDPYYEFITMRDYEELYLDPTRVYEL